MRRGPVRRKGDELSPATVVQIAVVLVLIGFMIHAARNVPHPSPAAPAVYEGETAAEVGNRPARPLPDWVKEMLAEGALNPAFFQNPAAEHPIGGRRIDYYFYPEDPRDLGEIMIIACDKPGTYARGGHLLFKDGTVLFWQPAGGADEYAALARAVLEGDRQTLVQKAIPIRATMEKQTDG